MLSSLLNQSTEGLTLQQLMICTIASIFLGVLVAGVHMFQNTYSKNFVMTLAVLPVLVQSVIMLVNGNLGTGMAVLGAFSLIRFRSVAGGSREITSIFWAMGVGLATGMGYITYVLVFSLVTSVFLLFLQWSNFGENNKIAERDIKITIPEDLDYPDMFNDIFEKYTLRYSLDRIRTTNLGSLYELCYFVALKDRSQEKELLDQLRQRNGNLVVSSGKVAANRDEL